MPLRRSRRNRSGPAAGSTGLEADRTYGIWGMVALFAVLAIGGLVALIVVGGSDERSAQVVTPQTLPDGYEDPSTTVDGSSATTPEATPPTFSDGTPGPEGVADITVASGTTSLTFEPPAGRTTPEGGIVDGMSSAIAPTTVTPAEDGGSLVIRIDCARSAEEFLAQVTVTEAETTVTVAAAIVAPDDGPPCAAGAASRVITVPLSEPLGERSIASVPAGAIPDAPG